jgi:hypothetical protein
MLREVHQKEVKAKIGWAEIQKHIIFTMHEAAQRRKPERNGGDTGESTFRKGYISSSGGARRPILG